MICGTTPKHIFKLPFDCLAVATAMVIYAQDDVEILRKNTEDCKMDGNTISVQLSQKETLLFNHKKNVQIQLRVLTTSGEALASPVYVKDVQQCLNDEVL